MLSYEKTGSCKNFPLIFLHGFLGNKHDWKYVVSKLSDRFFCISIDLPGHGESPIKDNASFDDFKMVLMQFIKRKKLEKLALVGYSMGGRIAHYLHNHSLKDQLCICIGSHLGIENKNEIEKRKIWNKAILARLEDGSIDDFLKFWYSQKIFETFRESHIYLNTLKHRTKNKKEFLKKAFLAFCVLKQKVLRPDSKTYFIAGQKDDKYLKYYKKIKCPHHILENASHVVHLENPRGLAAKIKEILHGNC